MDAEPRKVCIKCGVNALLNEFKPRRGGGLTRICRPCLARTAATRWEAAKCGHGRQRSRCHVCGGVGLCGHGRQRSQCRDCEGVGICEHGHQRGRCRSCAVDVVAFTVDEWIRSSRANDRKSGRFDADHHIDRDSLRSLIEESFDICHYKACQRPLQYRHRAADFATIERLDNAIGHIKSNCVIACQACNMRHKGPGLYEPLDAVAPDLLAGVVGIEL